jgi:hypothetical protein
MICCLLSGFVAPAAAAVGGGGVVVAVGLHDSQSKKSRHGKKHPFKRLSH